MKKELKLTTSANEEILLSTTSSYSHLMINTSSHIFGLNLEELTEFIEELKYYKDLLQN